jgi:hypothetical protein
MAPGSWPKRQHDSPHTHIYNEQWELSRKPGADANFATGQRTHHETETQQQIHFACICIYISLLISHEAFKIKMQNAECKCGMCRRMIKVGRLVEWALILTHTHTHAHTHVGWLSEMQNWDWDTVHCGLRPCSKYSVASRGGKTPQIRMLWPKPPSANLIKAPTLRLDWSVLIGSIVFWLNLNWPINELFWKNSKKERFLLLVITIKS